jgi:hypothetical protein
LKKEGDAADAESNLNTRTSLDFIHISLDDVLTCFLPSEPVGKEGWHQAASSQASSNEKLG